MPSDKMMTIAVTVKHTKPCFAPVECEAVHTWSISSRHRPLRTGSCVWWLYWVATASGSTIGAGSRYEGDLPRRSRSFCCRSHGRTPSSSRQAEDVYRPNRQHPTVSARHRVGDLSAYEWLAALAEGRRGAVCDQRGWPSGHSRLDALLGRRPAAGIEAARSFQHPLGVEIGWGLDP